VNIRTNPKYPGKFIAIEGVDGAGKSTVVNTLHQLIQEAVPGQEVVRLRAPDGPIRKVLLEREYPLTPESELLLYAASHADILSSQTIPALQRGAIVICDRFLFSLMAYQGFGRKLLPQVDDLINNFIKPPELDHLVFVQANSDVCAKRLRERGNMDFMDTEAEEFHTSVRNGMLTLMEFEEKHKPERFSRISNNTTLNELDKTCRHWTNYHFLGIEQRR